ncbi:hypothetical protein EB75_22285 [Mycobacterium sp. ST-F2]|uniref:hypothetical protein n=1 Tax=Mycobacterium sp. ST-F2 TaxID=1490484 RepID=UPI00096836A9|nr:hypothetical protein [Mycobacterium sp. ST-F2]OKH79808.1 hypothetical protein EB75_22285 [Mycobacterium sp. ST-F2]
MWCRRLKRRYGRRHGWQWGRPFGRRHDGHRKRHRRRGERGDRRIIGCRNGIGGAQQCGQQLPVDHPEHEGFHLLIDDLTGSRGITDPGQDRAGGRTPRVAMPGGLRVGPHHGIDLGVDGAPQFVPQYRQRLRAALQVRDHVLGRDCHGAQKSGGRVAARTRPLGRQLPIPVALQP